MPACSFLIVAYPLLCTKSISWLEPWPEPSKSSDNPKKNFDIYCENYSECFHRYVLLLPFQELGC